MLEWESDLGHAYNDCYYAFTLYKSPILRTMLRTCELRVGSLRLKACCYTVDVRNKLKTR